MKKAKEYANEIVVAYGDFVMGGDEKIFSRKMSDVFISIAVNEVQELRQIRKVSTDNGLIPIFKEQRQKYSVVCKVVNTVKSNLLSVTDFDEVIKELYPSIYEWYVSNVVAQHHS